MTRKHRHHTRIKVCGITNPEDAQAVAQYGADALGMIFYEKSPRNVSLTQAQQICSNLAPFLTTVAVVVNPQAAWLEHMIQQTGVDRIQFHGDETPGQCDNAARPYYKVLRVRNSEQITACVAQYQRAAALMLDTYVKGVPGGTGRTFD